jgi:hypothetical protein
LSLPLLWLLWSQQWLFHVVAEAIVADNQAMLGLGGLAIQAVPTTITLTMTAAVRIMAAVMVEVIMEVVTAAAVVIIDLDMSRLPNKSRARVKTI